MIRKCTFDSDSFYFSHIIYIIFQPLNPFPPHSWALKDRKAVFLREIMWIFLDNLADIASLRIHFSLHLWALKNKKGVFFTEILWLFLPNLPRKLTYTTVPPRLLALKDTKRLFFSEIFWLFQHDLLRKLTYTTVPPSFMGAEGYEKIIFHRKPVFFPS